MQKIIFLIVLSALISLLSVSPNYATPKIGVDIGLAGVENFGPELGLGINIFLPLHDKYLVNLSYLGWTGGDGNYERLVEANDILTLLNGIYFGNRGIQLLILYNVYNTSKTKISIGGGLSQIQMYKVIDKFLKKSYQYEGAICLSSMCMREVYKKLSIYLKGHISFESKDYFNFNEFESPIWGGLSVGIGFSL